MSVILAVFHSSQPGTCQSAGLLRRTNTGHINTGTSSIVFFFIPKSPESRRKPTEYHSLPFHAATAAKTHYGELLIPRGTGWGNKNGEQTPWATESWLCKQMCFLIACRKRCACVAQPGSNSRFLFVCSFPSPSIFTNKSSDSAALIGSPGAAAYALVVCSYVVVLLADSAECF